MLLRPTTPIPPPPYPAVLLIPPFHLSVSVTGSCSEEETHSLTCTRVFCRRFVLSSPSLVLTARAFSPTSYPQQINPHTELPPPPLPPERKKRERTNEKNPHPTLCVKSLFRLQTLLHNHSASPKFELTAIPPPQRGPPPPPLCFTLLFPSNPRAACSLRIDEPPLLLMYEREPALCVLACHSASPPVLTPYWRTTHPSSRSQVHPFQWLVPRSGTWWRCTPPPNSRGALRFFLRRQKLKSKSIHYPLLLSACLQVSHIHTPSFAYRAKGPSPPHHVIALLRVMP